MKRQNKIKPDQVNWEAFQTSASIDLKDIEYKINSTRIYTQNFVDNTFRKLESVIYNTAKHTQTNNICNNHTVQNNIMNENTNRSLETIQKDIVTKEQQKWKNILDNNNPKEIRDSME